MTTQDETANNAEPTAICDRFEALYTGAIADTLDEHGLPEQTIRAGIDPLDRSMSMAGFAYPAVGCPNANVDPEQQTRRLLQWVEDAPSEAVLALETNDGTSAHVGELMTTALTSQGCRGCVLDGGTRDSEFILEQGFPVFTGYQTPEDSVVRWELLDWDVDIVLGGVEVSPGDVIVGDLDGVVVVPRGIAQTVLEETEARADDEQTVRGAIRDGRSPLDAYDQYGVF